MTETITITEIVKKELLHITGKEKTEDATIALLMGEMIHGGTNISEELAVKSADLGFTSISKPTIEKLLSGSYPPSENVIANIAESTMKEAMAMCS